MMENKSAAVDVPIFNYNPAKIKGKVVLAPVPVTFQPFIAHIIMVWAELDTRFVQLLGAMIKESKTKYRNGWERLPFDQRREMFVAEAKKVFANTPQLRDRLTKIAEGADAVLLRRNVLVHGRVKLIFDKDKDGNRIIAIEATGRQRKKDFSHRYTLGEIEDLFYECGHLAGHLASLISLDDLPQPPLSSQEKSRLQAVLAHNQSDQSNPATP